MAYFYGTTRGNRGEATRCGSRKSGIVTHCASHKGAIRCYAYVDVNGVDCVLVEKVRWQGAGGNWILHDGPIGKCDIAKIDNNPHFPDTE